MLWSIEIMWSMRLPLLWPTNTHQILNGSRSPILQYSMICTGIQNSYIEWKKNMDIFISSFLYKGLISFDIFCWKNNQWLRAWAHVNLYYILASLQVLAFASGWAKQYVSYVLLNCTLHFNIPLKIGINGQNKHTHWCICLPSILAHLVPLGKVTATAILQLGPVLLLRSDAVASLWQLVAQLSNESSTAIG